MTSAAFSCDIARSTRGSTTSPADTAGLPEARARIFSATVIGMARLLGPIWLDRRRRVAREAARGITCTRDRRYTERTPDRGQRPPEVSATTVYPVTLSSGSVE